MKKVVSKESARDLDCLMALYGQSILMWKCCSCDCNGFLRSNQPLMKESAS